MYNWRLLLLAFFAVFQPIASFNERNLVDGRQQCCDHRLERDSSYSLYGNTRLKLPSEDHHLTNQRREFREVRRDERRLEISPISRPAIDSRRHFKREDNRNTLEFAERPSRVESRLERQRDIRFQVRNEDRRTNFAREDLRNTRTERNRVEDNRRNLSRDVISRISRARENLVRYAGNSLSTVSTERHMQLSIDDNQRNSETRETRVDSRRERNLQTLRPRIVQYDRRVENERRIARSLDRLSRSNEARRYSLESQSGTYEERNVRQQTQDALSNDNERRSVERVRERADFDRKRSTIRSIRLAHRLDNADDRRSVDRIVREDDEHRASSNIGDRAYEEDKSRNIVRDGRSFRDERNFVREQKDYERRSTVFVRRVNDNIRERRDERSLSTARRSVSEDRNIRDHNREQSRYNIRIVSVDNRRGEKNQRLSRSEPRLTEDNRLTHKVSRNREIREYKRTRDVRDTRELSRDILKVRSESRITTAQRDNARNNDMKLQRRDDTRENREREIDEYRRTASERVTRQARDSMEQGREIVRDRFEVRLTRSQRNSARNNDVMQQRRDENRDARERDVDDYRRSSANERITHVRDEREQSRDIVRSRLETGLSRSQRHNARNNDVIQQRRGETRNTREREESGDRRSANERITSQIRDTREPSRKIARDNFRDRNDDVLQRRDDNRENREMTLQVRERISSERRQARENQPRMKSRNYRSEEAERQENDRQFGNRESRKLPSRMKDLEFARDSERRQTRNSELQSTETARRIESRSKTDFDSARIIATRTQFVSEKHAHEFNWQYLMFTIQGIYLCSIIMPMIMATNNKKIKNIGWWNPFQAVIKAD